MGSPFLSAIFSILINVVDIVVHNPTPFCVKKIEPFGSVNSLYITTGFPGVIYFGILSSSPTSLVYRLVRRLIEGSVD